jgi:hypothetical protein
MRSSRLISSLAVVTLLTAMSCTLEPAVGQPMAEAPGREPSSATLEDSPVVLSSTEVDTASVVDPGDDVASLAVNCSVVQFCHNPNTICRQLGCSLGAAENECKREVKTVCGSAKCPLTFVTSSRTRINLNCPPTVCAGGAIECGGRCCGRNATFCGGLRGAQCCDGIHCGGGCPC